MSPELARIFVAFVQNLPIDPQTEGLLLGFGWPFVFFAPTLVGVAVVALLIAATKDFIRSVRGR